MKKFSNALTVVASPLGKADRGTGLEDLHDLGVHSDGHLPFIFALLISLMDFVLYPFGVPLSEDGVEDIG